MLIQHFEFVEGWHGTLEYFEYRRSCDALKDRLILEHGLSVIRFRWNDKISEELIRKRLTERLL